MGLELIFKKAADTVFFIFKDAVLRGTFYSIMDTGFAEDTTSFPVSVILDSFSEEDIKYLSFSDSIQPQDAKGFVRGIELLQQVHANSDKLTLVNKDDSTSTFTVVAFDTDPLRVLYTFLLRKT